MSLYTRLSRHLGLSELCGALGRCENGRPENEVVEFEARLDSIKKYKWFE